MAQNPKVRDAGDVICADILRSTTALQAAIFDRLDGEPEAMRHITAMVFRIVRDFERLERLQ